MAARNQGAGVADVLAADQNGNPVYDFKGRLSFSWPSDGSGRPIAAKSKSGVQFPFGYGLNYNGQPAKMASLSEDAGVDAPNEAFTGEIVAQGAAQAPFSMFLGDSSNWKTPAEDFSSASLGKVLTSKGIDYRAQEDARQLTWQGNGRGLLSLQTQRQTDLPLSAEIGIKPILALPTRRITLGTGVLGCRVRGQLRRQT